MGKFNYTDRLIYGSREPRLSPDWVCNSGLNKRLGPRLTNPLVRATGPGGAVGEEHHEARLHDTGFSRRKKSNPGY